MVYHGGWWHTGVGGGCVGNRCEHRGQAMAAVEQESHSHYLMLLHVSLAHCIACPAAEVFQHASVLCGCGEVGIRLLQKGMHT